MTARTARTLNLIVPALVGAAVMLALLASASADTGGDFAPVDDAFSAGRRSGFLFVGLGLFAAVVFNAIRARLKPKGGEPAPGTWRAKLSIVVGGALAVVTAGVDMFASSRGLTPITTAAFGAIALYYGSKDDLPRGSKRKDEAAGEVDDGQVPS